MLWLSIWPKWTKQKYINNSVFNLKWCIYDLRINVVDKSWLKTTLSRIIEVYMVYIMYVHVVFVDADR